MVGRGDCESLDSPRQRVGGVQGPGSAISRVIHWCRSLMSRQDSLSCPGSWTKRRSPARTSEPLRCVGSRCKYMQGAFLVTWTIWKGRCPLKRKHPESVKWGYHDSITTRSMPDGPKHSGDFPRAAGAATWDVDAFGSLAKGKAMQKRWVGNPKRNQKLQG